MRRTCTAEKGEFIAALARPAHQRFPRRSGADSGHRAEPDLRTPRPPRAMRKAEGHWQPSERGHEPTPWLAMPPQQQGRSFVANGNPRGRLDRRKFMQFRPAIPLPARRSSPAADKLRGDAHQSQPTATPLFAARTSSRETATTGIRVGSARPLTALNPTRTPVKLPGPFTTTMAPTSRSVTPPLSAPRRQPPPAWKNNCALPDRSGREFRRSGRSSGQAPPNRQVRRYRCRAITTNQT